jgi:hypothetical protein
MHHGFVLTCLWVPFIGCIDDTFYGTKGENEHAKIYRWSLGCTRKGYDAEIAASASDTEKQIRVLRLARYDDVMIGCNYMTITGTCQSIQISRLIEVKTWTGRDLSRGKPKATPNRNLR